MTIAEYQEALRHACRAPEQMQLLRAALLGFLEELLHPAEVLSQIDVTQDRQIEFTQDSLFAHTAVGGMVEQARQYLLQRHPFDLASFHKEIGFLLWYLSRLCGTLGILFADALQKHLRSLQNHSSNNHVRGKRRRDLL